MLHLAAVSSELLALIQTVCAGEVFAAFRLVGGTALSLYLGHRQSTGADFFTDRAFDKKIIEQELLRLYPDALKLSEMLTDLLGRSLTSSSSSMIGKRRF